MKVAIDPGHGMDNASPGVFDTGAVKRIGSDTFAEADIVLRYALTLKQLFEANGISVFMTRSSSADSAPVGGRATRAKNAGCTHFISLHMNSFSRSQANGVEVQYRDDQKDKPLADRIQRKLLQVTGFNDHVNDKRTDLAVLRFNAGPAILIELGFISNDNDRNFLIRGENRDAVCQAIFDVVTGNG
jgi:N-acetylmuramoyl-L-alanine amidase